MKQLFIKQVFSALEAGEISPVMAAACFIINEQADESGIWQGSATKLYALLGGQVALVNVQKMLKKLYDKKLLKSMRKKGQSSVYPVAVVHASNEAVSAPIAKTSAVIIPEIPAQIPAVAPAIQKPNAEQSTKFLELVGIYGQELLGDALEVFGNSGGTDVNIFFKEVKLWVKAAQANE